MATKARWVERHDALFPPDCRDEQWLAYVGESGRSAISHDSRIRYRPNELAALARFVSAATLIDTLMELLPLDRVEHTAALPRKRAPTRCRIPPRRVVRQPPAGALVQAS